MTFEKKIEVLKKAIALQEKLYAEQKKKVDDDLDGIHELADHEYAEADRLVTMFDTRKTAMKYVLAFLEDDSLAQSYDEYLDLNLTA